MMLVAVVAALIGGGSVYFWPSNEAIQEQELQQPEPETTIESPVKNEFAGAVKYNCEKSGGSFNGNSCVCPISEEIGQTQESMYDESTGYCQSDIGGPASDAFPASVGLPYGDYAFYNNIVINNCEETGGDFLYSCDCPDGKTYDESTGYCK